MASGSSEVSIFWPVRRVRVVETGYEAEFGDVVAVAERGDAEIGLAEGVDVGRAAEGAESVALKADRLEGGVDAAEDGGHELLGALEAVGGAGEEFQVAEEFVGGLGEEDVAVDHDEVLGGAGCAGEAVAGDVEDFEGHAAGEDDGVRENVAGVGREAHVDLVVAGGGEEALGEFGREVGLDREGALEDAMGLGVDGADGVVAVIGGGVQDGVERGVEAVDGGGLVGVDVFDGRRVADGRGRHGGDSLSVLNIRVGGMVARRGRRCG